MKAEISAYIEIVGLMLTEARKSRLKLFALAAVILGGNWATSVCLGVLRSVYRCGNLSAANFDVSPADFICVGIVPVMLLSLIIEAKILGWESSSLRRLWACETRSVETDFFYLVLNCSNLNVLLGLVFSLGIGYYVQLRIQDAWGWKLLKDAPWATQFAAQWFAGSLLFYASHRLDHTRFLWEFHKLHHAAEEMTMANNFRQHPLINSLRAVFETLGGAILGIHPFVLLAYLAISGAIVVWQHGNVDWGLPLIERYVLIGAGGHRIHHSTLERHYNTNLGFFVLWDWLFGTLQIEPGSMSIPIGVEGTLHNRFGAAREMFLVQAVGMKSLWNAVR